MFTNLKRRHRVLETLIFSGAFCFVAVTTPMARAQTAKAQTANAPSVGFDFGGEKTTARSNGARLDGNAYIKSPQLDARADTIAFDFSNRQITNVRALGNVRLKMNLVPRGGGAPARIETTSANATLNPVTRTLVLSGKVDGFYQLPGGARNTLKGDKATIVYAAAGQFSADVAGGQSGVQLTIPAAQTAPGVVSPIGTITISGKDLSVDGAKSVAVVTGNARAVSSGGTTRFDIAAPSFSVTRDATGALTNLRATGRTRLKIDLPQPAESSTGSVNNSSRATYFEIAANSANVDAKSGATGTVLGTLTFDGEVSGFYRLQSADGKSSDNRFTGDRAVVKNPAATGANDLSDFQIEVTGAPVNIQTPFDLGF